CAPPVTRAIRSSSSMGATGSGDSPRDAVTLPADERHAPTGRPEMAEPGGEEGSVAGSTRGIGRAVAEALDDAGVHGAVAQRNEAECEAAAAAITERTGTRTRGVACDVRDAASCARLIERAVDEFGRLDILINNAGIGAFA